MTNVQKKILKLIEKTQGDEFWEMDKPLFREALYEFFDTFGVDVDGLHIEVKEEKDYQDTAGVEKIDAVVDIVNQSIRLQLTASYDKKWYFAFRSNSSLDEIKPPVGIIPMESEKIVQINGKKCVLYLFENASLGNQLFAIPVAVAEKLNIRQYDSEEVSGYEDFFSVINEYELPFFSSYNID